ncbi:hypothetical protein BH10ACT11_BH10ACT11_01360 [soil metagenome]
MWEELVTQRGGIALGDPDVANGATQAPFACLLVDDDELLPVIARIQEAPPVLLLKSGRVGGGEGARGALPITEADAAAALDQALAPDATWETDPDLGLELLVSGVPGVAQELLIPRFLYRRADRIYEYAAAMPGLQTRLTELIAGT